MKHTRLFFICFSILLTVLAIILIPLYADAESVDIPHLIASEAHARGIDPQVALYISWTESHWQAHPTPDGDGHILCQKTNVPVRSRGLWQINNCAHPEVTDAQAYDPVWSTKWALDQMVKDNGCGQWTNCPGKIFNQ